MIKDLYFSIKNYIRNIRVFHELLKNHYPWDAGYGWLALRLVLQDVKNYMVNDPPSPKLGIEKNIKDITIAIELLKRIEKENYQLDNFEFSSRFIRESDWGIEFTIDVTKLKDLPTIKARYKIEKSQKENDLELLTKLLKTRMKNWWE